MTCYDIVYIKGNPNSGTAQQHEKMNLCILNLIKIYDYEIIESEHKNLEGNKIPDARVYIGFSRGSRYLKKLPSTSLKISIGGISGSKIKLFKNKDDHIVLGDLSTSSLDAHFMISKSDIIKIKELVSEFLKKTKD